MSSNQGDGAKTPKSRKSRHCSDFCNTSFPYARFWCLGLLFDTKKSDHFYRWERKQYIYTFQDTVESVLAEEGIALGENDYINVPLDQRLKIIS